MVAMMVVDTPSFVVPVPSCPSCVVSGFLGTSRRLCFLNAGALFCVGSLMAYTCISATALPLFPQQMGRLVRDARALGAPSSKGQGAEGGELDRRWSEVAEHRVSKERIIVCVRICMSRLFCFFPLRVHFICPQFFQSVHFSLVVVVIVVVLVCVFFLDNSPNLPLSRPVAPVLTPMPRVLRARIIIPQSNLRAKWSARLQWVPKDVDVWRGILAVRSLVLKPREVSYAFG